MDNDFVFYAGIDWASDKHDLSVVDGSGKELLKGTFPHTVEGLQEIARKLDELSDGDRARVAIAIETPRGPVVETFIDGGFPVFSLNPKQLDRFRDRHAPSGSKDDELDAYVLATSLRTDPNCYREVRLGDEATQLLRELSRVDDELGRTLRRLTNQLRDQLSRFFPQLLDLCMAADETWFWKLIERVGDPSAAMTFKSRNAKQLLKEHRIRRHTVDDVLAVVRAPRMAVSPGTIKAALLHAVVLITQLRCVDEQKRQIERQMTAAISFLETPSPEGGEPRDAAILSSLPGVGRVVAATVLAEASHAIIERDLAAFRSHAGIAPVTRRSGKRKSVIMRRACNHRLREALYHWGRVAVQQDNRCRSLYKDQRQRGHSHGRAVRSVADSLGRLLFAMLKARMIFDPERWNVSTPAPAEA